MSQSIDAALIHAARLDTSKTAASTARLRQAASRAAPLRKAVDVEKTYFDVQGIGRVQLVQECGRDLIVEDETGARVTIPASRCVRVDQTAAALADQFTGEDLGAQMAAHENDFPSGAWHFLLGYLNATGAGASVARSMMILRKPAGVSASDEEAVALLAEMLARG